MTALVAAGVAACGAADEVVPVAAPDAAPDVPDAAGIVDCGSHLVCPTPASGVNVCGWVVDVETQVRIGMPQPDLICGVDDPRCTFAIAFHDGQAFLDAPATAPALAVGALTVDTCNRFRVEGIEAPPSGTLAIVIDDAAWIDDDHVPTATFHAVTSGAVRNRLPLFALRRTTAAAWEGVAPGLVDGGVVLDQYRRAGQPVADIPLDDGELAFVDELGTFSTIDPAQRVSGANGGVLRTGPATPGSTNHAPAGCVWEDGALPVPGVLGVSIRVAVDPDTAAECQ